MFTRRLLTLMLGLMLAGMIATTAAATASTISEDGPKIAGDHPEPFAMLKIGNGSELVFYRLPANSSDSRHDQRDTPREQLERVYPADERPGIGLAQYIPVGGMDPQTVPELRGANPHEIFYALSTRGTDVPGVLRELHDNRYDKTPQGWGLSKIKAPSAYNLSICPSTQQIVAGAVAATGLPHSYNELSKGPHNWPLWYVQDPGALFPSYANNLGVVTPGDAYYHVLLCKEDPLFLNTSVTVRLGYTEKSGYDTLSTGEIVWKLHNAGDQMSFLSWTFDSDLSGDNSWYWMLVVEGVYYNDTLHIGTAWS